MAKSPAKKTKEVESFDPFKKIKSKTGKSELASVQMKGQLATAVDQYAELHQQIKMLEGKQEGFKNAVVAEAKDQFAKRQFDGQSGNLKVLGNSDSVTFIAQNASSALTAEDLEVVAEKFGRKALAELTEPDYGSLKFKQDFISSEANQKRLFAALSKTFTEAELEDMFTPIAHKVVSNVIDAAASHVKSAEELVDLYTALKLKAYIKA